jgi:uncharacterized SAM-binding protein YcdF (DUF218 family)
MTPTPPPAPHANARRADAIDAVVVLGAAVSEAGVASAALRRRLAHGVTVWKQLEPAYLVVSGGIVGPPPAEAEVMRELAIELGVPPERIVEEDRAVNTFENAVYCGRIFHDRRWQRLVVVTDRFHLPRALFVFRRLGLPVAGAPVPGRCGLSRLEWTRAYLREFKSLIHSAYLFVIGRHKPIVDAVWHR